MDLVSLKLPIELFDWKFTSRLFLIGKEICKTSSGGLEYLRFG